MPSKSPKVALSRSTATPRPSAERSPTAVSACRRQVEALRGEAELLVELAAALGHALAGLGHGLLDQAVEVGEGLLQPLHGGAEPVGRAVPGGAHGLEGALAGGAEGLEGVRGAALHRLGGLAAGGAGVLHHLLAARRRQIQALGGERELLIHLAAALGDALAGLDHGRFDHAVEIGEGRPEPIDGGGETLGRAIPGGAERVETPLAGGAERLQRVGGAPLHCLGRLVAGGAGALHDPLAACRRLIQPLPREHQLVLHLAAALGNALAGLGHRRLDHAVEVAEGRLEPLHGDTKTVGGALADRRQPASAATFSPPAAKARPTVISTTDTWPASRSVAAVRSRCTACSTAWAWLWSAWLSLPT